MDDDTEDVTLLPRHRVGHGRRTGDRETWKMITLIITLVSLIFTAGYNWRRVEETASAHTALEVDVRTNYVRRDVQAETLRNIDQRLQEIHDQLQRLEDARRRDTAR